MVPNVVSKIFQKLHFVNFRVLNTTLIRYKIYHNQIEKYAYLPVAVSVEQLDG